ncbi:MULTISPECIES: hypothetical protein [unclassified Paenibacillus]|uniref:hypothetical protein n=1 Tax=unclassified Paenibacillus TaxID=185978 RepID=UPI002405903F|nr:MULTISPECIES: hypothetical protein [unclassified Paenibacillus]MDF9845131.1 chromosome segregation ATPase [Paenibacillus sp. PastF-2]MDF9851730.1 chromosome segregation ATPase [Paenibacillus sp. PastM-2]MDF9858317.1 chromosome segregation ATPase [Paenibacillus sp. PastF-1]MDH6483603.1 chromosome segregation ATPase [Paenibacillus sp. PastH-2]MDH6510992.1 chromosome segregation ATPase [Paenibacillus sp. PastM-3]
MLTPERKEEIRRKFESNKRSLEKASSLAYEASVMGLELLAALEEAERQLHQTKITSSVHESNSDAYFAECERLRGGLAEAQQTLAVKDDTIKFLDSKLTEAQQTIARQREALEKIANCTGIGYEGAWRNAVSLAQAALANKKGDKPDVD